LKNPFDDETATYRVLVNDDGQYSLWPDAIPAPEGWTPTGPTGTRDACLKWIDETWIDMRPRGLST
jgi:MbtH protein